MLKKIWKEIKILNLMVLMLFFGFTITLHMHYRDNILYRKLCEDKFHKDYMVCYGIPQNHNNTAENLDSITNIIQSASSHTIAMTGLRLFISCIFSCFLCSWSDSCGRKFPLLIAVIGENFDIVSYFCKDCPNIYFISFLYILTIISGFSGGYICILTMAYCSLIDNSTDGNRILAFTMINFSYMLGIILAVVSYRQMPIGSTIFLTLLSLVGARCFLILWILMTFVDKKFNSNPEKITKKVKMLLSRNHFKDTYEALTKQRRHCGNEQLILIVGSAIPVMTTYSLIEGVVFGIVFHSTLFKSFADYERITFYFALYSCFAEAIVIIILRCAIKFKDTTLGIIGFFNLYFNGFIGAFAIDYLTFLGGLGLTSLKGFTAVALRTQYSKIIDENERGKMVFVYCCGEIMAMFIGYSLYLKLRGIITPRDDLLPQMIMSFVIILSLCTFTFQIMSIHTDHLFAKCYRDVPAESLTRSQHLSEPEESER